MNDLDLDFDLDEHVAEVGRHFRGTVRRAQHLDDLNDDPRAGVRALRLSLRYETEGRGDTDSAVVSGVELPVDEYGGIAQRFELPVPRGGPISYDGRLIRVWWEIEARLDIRLRIDTKATVAVLVVPAGGWSIYNRAHPLRK